MIQAPHATRNGALDSLRPRAGAVVAERYSMPAATASDTTMWAMGGELREGSNATIGAVTDRSVTILNDRGVRCFIQGSTNRGVAVRGPEVDVDIFAEWPKTADNSLISEKALKRVLKKHFDLSRHFQWRASNDRVVFGNLLLQGSSQQHPVDITFTQSTTDFDQHEQFVNSLESSDPKVRLLAVALNRWAKNFTDGRYKIPGFVLEHIAALEIKNSPPRTTEVTPSMMVSCLKCLLHRKFLSQVPHVDLSKAVWSAECVPAATDCIAHFGGSPVR
jgi:hypothetical protein